MTSAFIIHIHPKLEPDPNDEITALLRLLISTTDGTTSGGSVPENHEWNGPPPVIYLAQLLLYISFGASLVSALIAILARQWLNQYIFSGAWGSTTAYCRNRQHKYDGFIDWGNFFITSAPLLLQFALLYLGISLIVYISTVDAWLAMAFSIFMGFFLLIYLSIVVLAVINPGHPYQTPVSIGIHSLLGFLARDPPDPSYSASTRYFKPIGAIRTGAWGPGVNDPAPDRRRALKQGPDTLDVRCVSWILRTSQDMRTLLSALAYLATMMELPCLGSTLAGSCFSILVYCVKVYGHNVVVDKGREQLAESSALCFLRTLSHPRSFNTTRVRRAYNKTFPLGARFDDLPSHQTFRTIHRVLNPDVERALRPKIEWRGYNPSTHEHATFARALLELACSEYRGNGHRRKVSCWILRFALHSLSFDPLPSTSVVIDCLSAIAIDMGCDFISTGIVTPNERCVSIQ